MLHSKYSKKDLIEKFVILLSTVFVFLLWFLKMYNLSYIVAIMTFLIDVYACIKTRKNVYGFFMFFVILYFDYSVIISKYVVKIKDFESIYSRVQFSDTMFIGIAILYIFHALVFILLKKGFFQEKKDIFCMEKKKEKKEYSYKFTLFLTLATIVTAYVLIDYLFLHILPIKATIYEYLLIPFILISYYGRDNKIIRSVVLILILTSVAVNVINGDRIASLVPLIAYALIYFYNKLTSKRIIIISILGIIVYTFFGLYGDIIVNKEDMRKLSIKYLYETIEKRKFALDTSYSAYWTGLTYIETKNYKSFSDRVNNFIYYIGPYTVLGTKSEYKQLSIISRQYHLHYNGGYITSYFYYWLGIFGIFVLAIFIILYLNTFSKINCKSSDFQKIMYVYFICGIPRWYLYYPTHLIRGALILFICYCAFAIFTSAENKKNIMSGDTNEKKD